MKKILILSLFVSLLFSSCSKCTSTTNFNEKNEVDTVVVVNNTIDVDHAIATDREAMYLKFGDNYRWFETCILLPEFLDSENVTSEPSMLVNIFQSIIEYGNGADTYVWKFQHFTDGTVNIDSIHSFWIEDFPLDRDTIKLSYNQAFERMMESNFPKPHSKNVVLRNPIGPVGVNAQWVFGNINEQIWIDAVTGDAKNSNPAFPEEKGFKMPLGEWP
jgi:hypothetical protein